MSLEIQVFFDILCKVSFIYLLHLSFIFLIKLIYQFVTLIWFLMNYSIISKIDNIQRSISNIQNDIDNLVIILPKNKTKMI